MMRSSREFSWRTAVLTGVVTVAGLAPTSVAADVDDVADKLNRVERDLRDLQYEVYKGSPPATTNGIPAPAASGARLNDMEESLRELRGQVESLTFQVKQLTEQLDRSRREADYRIGALEGGAPATLPGRIDTPSSIAQSSKANQPKSLSGSTSFQGGSNLVAPKPGSLGAIPADEVPDDEGFAQTPRQQYDAAMELLTKAQYLEAQSAFRTFVAANPKDELAGPAQYWVGDIAFTQKDYQSAAKSFADVLKRYSKTAKAPDAMLKLGLSLMELGQKKEGCTTLGAIKAKYPNANKAVLDRAAKRAAEAKCV